MRYRIPQQSDGGSGESGGRNRVLAHFLAGFFRNALGLGLELFCKIRGSSHEGSGGLGNRVAGVSAGAREAIEKAGGSVDVIEVVPAADKHKAKHRKGARSQAKAGA